jgi:hypothetical protein
MGSRHCMARYNLTSHVSPVEELGRLIEIGQSFQLNADVIGDEPHWDDAARDTVHLINTFQERMPPP